MPKDLQPLEFGKLSWNDPEAVATSLRTMRAQLESRARRANEWYMARRRWFKRLSWVLRGAAVVFGMAGGVVPFVDQSLQPLVDQDWQPIVHDLGYLCIALSGAALLANSALGLSSSWSRYMQAALRLQAALNTFQFDWAQIQLGIAGTPGPDQTRQALQTLKAFSQILDEIIQTETERWSVDLGESMRRLEALSQQHRGHDETPPPPAP
jgi:SMODS and SLOG-associating 2TM effector domain 2